MRSPRSFRRATMAPEAQGCRVGTTDGWTVANCLDKVEVVAMTTRLVHSFAEKCLCLGGISKV